MDHKQLRKKRRNALTRRDFLRDSGLALLGLASLSLPVRSIAQAELQVQQSGVEFLHGVASGDPRADSVILWTRLSTAFPREIALQWQLAADPGFRQLVQTGMTRTGPAQDYTVKVDATGLQPASSYYYRFLVGSAPSPVGRTRTLAAEGGARARIAIASCASLAHGYFNAYRRIAERAELDFVLHLGDYIYEYGTGQFGDLRAYEPPHELLTLADYRSRYAQYRRDPDLQEMHRQHPIVPVWDDHEFADNAWAGGAANHDPATEGPWAARLAAALQAWHEWMPVRVVDPTDLRQRAHALSLGRLAEMLVLEERVSARSQQLAADPQTHTFREAGEFLDPTRQMLGTNQEAWLAERLRNSQARWKIVAQGTMLAQLKIVPGANAAGGGIFINPDQWDGYQPARQRLFEVLSGDGAHAGVGNVVVLSADLHSSWAAELTPDPNNGNPAVGGYDAATGQGALAVEFTATSVTSPVLPGIPRESGGLLERVNPHFKYIELESRGYALLDIDEERVNCEWWYVDTVGAPSSGQRLGAAWQVRSGQAHLLPGVATQAGIGGAPQAP